MKTVIIPKVSSCPFLPSPSLPPQVNAAVSVVTVDLIISRVLCVSIAQCNQFLQSSQPAHLITCSGISLTCSCFPQCPIAWTQHIVPLPIRLIVDVQAVPFWTTTDICAWGFRGQGPFYSSRTNALECSVWIVQMSTTCFLKYLQPFYKSDFIQTLNICSQNIINKKKSHSDSGDGSVNKALVTQA